MQSTFENRRDVNDNSFPFPFLTSCSKIYTVSELETVPENPIPSASELKSMKETESDREENCEMTDKYEHSVKESRRAGSGLVSRFSIKGLARRRQFSAKRKNIRPVIEASGEPEKSQILIFQNKENVESSTSLKTSTSDTFDTLQPPARMHHKRKFQRTDLFNSEGECELTNRDLGIDEKTFALYKEFLRYDPALESENNLHASKTRISSRSPQRIPFIYANSRNSSLISDNSFPNSKPGSFEVASNKKTMPLIDRYDLNELRAHSLTTGSSADFDDPSAHPRPITDGSICYSVPSVYSASMKPQMAQKVNDHNSSREYHVSEQEVENSP